MKDTRNVFQRLLNTEINDTKTYTDSGYVHFLETGNTNWSDRNSKAFSDEGYKKNVIVYRCIREISDNLAGLKWTVSKTNGDQFEDHPLLKLLNRPNPMQGKAAFFRSLHTFKQLTGNSYLHGVGSDQKPPTEIYVLSPHHMTVKPGKRMLIPEAYEYRPDGAPIRFAVDQLTGTSEILHLKTVNPLSEWTGMSPLQAAAFSVDIHNESSSWNMKLLQSGARPSGAFFVKDGLTPEQREQAKESLRDNHQGGTNAGKPMVLEGGFDFKEMQLSPKDMDYLNARNTAARDIAMAFRIPPILLNMGSDTTYANMSEARLALWEENLIPEADYLVDELNNWLTPMFGDDIVLGYDKDSIQALSYRRKIIYDTVENADFLTLNEKRQACDFEPVDGGDELLIPANVLPLSYQDEGELDEVEEPLVEDDMQEEDEKSLEPDSLSVKGSMSTGLRDGHSHNFDTDSKVGTTSVDDDHSHTYVIGDSKTGISDGHSHPMPDLIWVDDE